MTAAFVRRPNRFLVVARLHGGGEVTAYLPNTGRLEHLTEPGRPFVLRRDGGQHRTTEFTAIRAWDGTWVALEASLAPRLLTEWLDAGHPLGPFGSVTDLRTEVSRGRHRIDLVATTDGGPVWVEVKSGGRSAATAALLSRTPSTRGTTHLAALADLVDGGERAAVAFVVQRGDVDRLLIGGDADPGWLDAVRTAGAGGVAVLAFGCAVTETEVHIDRALPVEWAN